MNNGVDVDKYVAVFGSGMGNVSLCAGNAFFIVDLEAGLDVRHTTESLEEGPGQIYGAGVNGGPITIIDTDPAMGTKGGDPEDCFAIMLALNSPEIEEDEKK